MLLENKKYIHKKNAFSLAEILVAMVLLSIIFVLSAPILTKLALRTGDLMKGGTRSTAFYYTTSNNDNNHPCYTTRLNKEDGTEIERTVIEQTNSDCTQYTFTVPKNVYKVDLALVAGGGGGGGAAGAQVKKTSYSYTNAITGKKFDSYKVKDITFDVIVGSGKNGKGEINKTTGEYEAIGGDSGAIIRDYVVPKEGLRLKINSTNPYVKYNFISTVNESFLDNPYYIQPWVNVYNSENINFGTSGIETVFQKTFENLSVNKGQAGPKRENSDSTTYFGIGGLSPYDGTRFGYGAGKNIEITCGEGIRSGDYDYFNNSYNKITVTTEEPPKIGQGGAGGGAIKINNFEVTPGEQYTIVVGKGGAGGLKGITSESPTIGQDGQSGTCTAVYRGNNLLFMVIGGAGGFGGDNNNSLQTRNLNLIVYNPNNINIADLEIDDEILSLDNNIGSNFNNLIELPNNNLRTSLAVYKFMDTQNNGADQYKAYRALNYNQIGGLKGIGVNEEDKNYLASYNNFVKKAESLTSIDDFEAAVKINKQYVYTGFFEKYAIGTEYIYTGGLGGFSGLGGKAGCGGYFVGNKDSWIIKDEGEPGTFFTRLVVDSTAFGNIKDFFLIHTATNNLQTFQVADYYDNCRIDTPDGQSATFVAPRIGGGAEPSLGQAGAGGGGGGYSINLGAGNGGAGQNGYVVISWRK